VGKIPGPEVELLNMIEANILDKRKDGSMTPDTLKAAFLLKPAVKSKSNTKMMSETMKSLSLLWFEVTVKVRVAF
jgi:hypothetical protein